MWKQNSEMVVKNIIFISHLLDYNNNWIAYIKHFKESYKTFKGLNLIIIVGLIMISS